MLLFRASLAASRAGRSEAMEETPSTSHFPSQAPFSLRCYRSIKQIGVRGWILRDYPGLSSNFSDPRIPYLKMVPKWKDNRRNLGRVAPQ